MHKKIAFQGVDSKEFMPFFVDISQSEKNKKRVVD